MEELQKQTVMLFDAIFEDARTLFGKLDIDLDPTCMIISMKNLAKGTPHGRIQTEKDKSSTDPTEFGYSEDFFQKIKTRAKDFELNNSEEFSHLNQGNIEFNDEYKQVIKNLAYIEAIENTLNAEEENEDIISFSSYPVATSGFTTFCVLQLNRKIFNRYYKLKNASLMVRRADINSFSISASLLGTVVNRFLRKCTTYFNNLEIFYRNISPYFLYSPGNEAEIDEIINSAGQFLIHSIAQSAISEARVSLLNRRDLFYTFNEISTLRYEGIEGIGKISISNRNHPNINEIISLTRPIQIDDFSAVRKMLEITSEKMFLISDSNYIYGVGEMTGKYNKKDEDLFFINFTKHFEWELSHDDEVLMIVNYGQPRLPSLHINKSRFRNQMKRIFSEISNENINSLWELIISASKQKHGTMVVISNEAEEEAVRLQSQAIPINPINITPELIDKLTAIDGAILINPFDLKCYAIGVILDGLATNKGSAARGSRYNSAVRYCELKDGTCLAIVISEDSTIDMVH